MKHLTPTALPQLFCVPLMICLPMLVCLAASCVPARAPVSDSCSSNAHCPANGKVYCDLAIGRCVPCIGSCPGSETDAGGSTDTTSGSDAAVTSDAGSDTTSDTASSTDTAAASDAGRAGDVAAGADTATGDDVTAVDGADGGGLITSCVGQCGEYLGDLGECNCDENCELYDDCCDDYAKVCGGTSGDDAQMSDAASTTDITASADAGSGDIGMPFEITGTRTP